jgi:hypothetical protein
MTALRAITGSREEREGHRIYSFEHSRLPASFLFISGPLTDREVATFDLGVLGVLAVKFSE